MSWGQAETVSIPMNVEFASLKVDSFKGFTVLCAVYIVGIFYEKYRV